MTFPEKIAGDPVIIDDVCAISFVPQFKGWYAVVVYSMAPRRMKVRVDFTQCSRYCVFYPFVGAVSVEEMIAELTITPYRIRNIGVVGPDKDSGLSSRTLLFTQLKYITHIFLENEEGNMIPASKFRRNGKLFSSSSESVPNFSSTTFADTWPASFSNLRVNDFIVSRRTETIILSSADASSLKGTKRGSSEGLEVPQVVLYTDEIADGAAYLISVVSKSKIPYSLFYQILYNGELSNKTVGTSTLLSNSKERDVKEMNSSTFYFVPMDGWECESIEALTGYLPGNGDLALGWVVRRDVSAENSHPSLLYRCTVIPCEPDNGQPYSQQITGETIRRTTTMMKIKMMMMIEQKKEISLNYYGGRMVEGKLSSSLPRESKYLHSKTGTPISTRSKHEKPSIQGKVFSRLSVSPGSSNKRVTGTVMKVDSTKQKVMNPSEERCNFSPDPLPSRRLLMEEAFVNPESLGEELCELRESLWKKKTETELSDKYHESVHDMETHYMQELHMSLKNIRAEIEAQIEEEVERRLSSSEMMRLSQQSHLMESPQTTPQQNDVKNENSTLNSTEEKNSSLIPSSPVAIISSTLRQIEVNEMMDRISIEASATAERRFLLMNWQQPKCLICGLPVPSWSLSVQDPVNGNKTHFLCFAELREHLYTQESNDESNFSINTRDGRSFSMETPG
ncbi:uncharacterized protein TM35_000053440 [Trypanosoma theileri]|uniref:Uncharacterized protein n=1 Tax=Trypanosoma theileri TaxID=67003 RepID=A0A1X0P4I9_9TRYP|nr:uncharacterized protein TM35_000053440 [Trypanosoma theileri]ORC91748.1 hypothetical protein TM35_000053440 [Trypanosoma theileri]